MSRLLNYGNLAAYVLNIVSTYIIGTTGKVGKTNSEVSAEYPTLFTPAGYAFAIWGLIFLAEGVFSIYQLTPSQRDSVAVQKGVSVWWIVMVLLQVGWSLSFATEKIAISMAFMLGIFVSLLALNVGLKKTLRRPSMLEYWCIQFPFSLNFGWITAATLANANILTVSMDKANLPSILATSVCACVCVCVAALLGAGGLEDAVFCLVLVWAGVAVGKQLDAPVDEIAAKFPSFVTQGLKEAVYVCVGFVCVCVLVAGGRKVVSVRKGEGEEGGEGAAPGTPGASRALLKH